MTEPKYALCPHCGYANMKPDGSCGLCIPPEFRAETARAVFTQAVRKHMIEGQVKDDVVPAWFSALARDSVIGADALIAALRKPPSK